VKYAVSGVGAGGCDRIASPSNFFRQVQAKFKTIWLNLDKLSKIWEKFD